MQATIPKQRSGGLDYKWILAMVVVLGAFMSILDSTIVNIAIPRLETAFGAGVNTVEWVLTGYTLAQAVAVPLVAYFTDRFGIKRFYIFSLTAFTIGSAMCGLAWSLPLLIVFRVLQGLGGAALMPLSMTLLFSVFPPEERGMAMGFFGVPVLLAPALGPTLGGWLVTYTGWQVIFYLNVPIGILAVILSMIFMRDSQVRKRPHFDLLGFCFVTVGLVLTLYGFSSASTDGWSSSTVVGCMSVGILSLITFVLIELSISKRGGNPLLNLRLFANGPFATSNIASILVTFTMFGGLFLFPLYLQNLRQLNAYEAGLVLLPQALASMVSVVVGGRLVDKLGVKAVVIPGLIILGISTWGMTFMDSHTAMSSLQILLILRGLSIGLVLQPLSVSMMTDIPPRQLAQATSINTVTRSVAVSLGVAVLATVISTQITTHYGHLAEQVTPFSKLGGLMLGLQAYFVSHGASLASAHAASLQELSFIIKGQAFVLAMQDAFFLTFVMVFAALIAVMLIRTKKKQLAPAPSSSFTAEDAKLNEEVAAARAEAMMAG